MARRPLTPEDLAEMGEQGKSGGTLGEMEARKREMMEKKKPKRGYFKGRRDKRTILDRIKSMAGIGDGEEDE